MSRFGLVAINMIVTVVLLAGLELFASAFVTLPRAHMLRSWRLDHQYKPNTSRVSTLYIADNPDFPDPYLHAYNAQGWLEHDDVPREKPAGTFRIFYLGDSFTAGTLPMDQSVPSRVERALNTLVRDGRHVEVINTGTESYSPIVYYILYRFVLREYEPNLIVINVDMTDDLNDWIYQ